MFKFYSRSKTTTITNFILDEIKRSISISVYYGWKRSIRNGRWREIDLKIIFWLQISYSPHSGTNTDMRYVFMYIKHHTKICRWYLLVVILKIDIEYTFLVRFHIFSRNDRLYCDVLAMANMEYCYQNSS